MSLTKYKYMPKYYGLAYLCSTPWKEFCYVQNQYINTYLLDKTSYTKISVISELQFYKHVFMNMTFPLWGQIYQ